jgi:hypothetical protein
MVLLGALAVTCFHLADRPGQAPPDGFGKPSHHTPRIHPGVGWFPVPQRGLRSTDRWLGHVRRITALVYSVLPAPFGSATKRFIRLMDLSSPCITQRRFYYRASLTACSGHAHRNSRWKRARPLCARRTAVRVGETGACRAGEWRAKYSDRRSGYVEPIRHSTAGRRLLHRRKPGTIPFSGAATARPSVCSGRIGPGSTPMAFTPNGALIAA